MNHKFRPPKQNDTEGWKLVMYLVQNGFYFDRFWVPHPTEKDTKYYPGYPNTFREAEEFVARYRAYGIPIEILKERTYVGRR